MAANQVDFKILPSDQFSVYSPATRSDKVITYFTLLSKLRGDILSVGQDDDPNNIVSAFYSSVGGTQTLHLVKADGSEVTASVSEPTVGTVTSVDLTAGTAISVSGGPITTSGSITVTNTAPDQVVVLTASTGISTSGTYPNFTITNSAPDQVVSLTGAGTTSISGTYPNFTITSDDQYDGTVTSVDLTAGTGISVSGGPITTSGSITVTNTAPDQVVVLTGAGTTSISGTYPSFTITSNDQFAGTVTSVGTSAPLTGGTITTTGTIGITQSSTTTDGYLSSANFVIFNDKQGAITLTTTGSSGAATFISNTLNIPNYGSALTGYVPYTGANQTVNLNTQQLEAGHTILTTNGSTETLTVNHTSGSGIGINITKGGNNEGLRVNKTSGSGNAATIIGTLEATKIVKTGGTTSQFLKANGDVDSSVYYLASNPSGFTNNLGTVTSIDLTAGTGITVSGGPVTTSGSITVNNNDRGSSQNIFKNFAVAGQSTIVADTNDDTLTVVAGTGVTITTNDVTDTLTISATGSGGTVTSIATSAPITGGTITTTGTIGITQAGVATDGYLSSTDWNTFNSKEPALTKGNLTEATSSVLTITGGIGAVIGSGTTIQVAQAGVSTSGFLSSTDWNTFNGKQGALTFSAPLVNTSGTVSIPAATGLVDGYLSAANFATFNGKQDAITLTTTGTTGAATLIGATLNIPNYADQFVGTVTSVDMSVPTGFAISGNPITTSGTLAVAFAAGYSLPTNASQTTWDTAYNDSITAFAYNTSTAVLTLTQQDAGTLTATITLQPFSTTNLVEGTNLYYTDVRARLALGEGTGISYNTTTGVITNSAPDQVVVLTSGTGISTSGTYPSFTITNTAPDQVVVLTAGTGITTSGTYPSFTVTNSAPDQVVSLTGAGTTTISGAYPSFTITSSDQFAGTVTSVNLTASTGISVSGGPITTSGSITVTNTAPDQTVVLTAGTGISTSGTYPSFTVTNSAPDLTVVLAASTGITTSGTYPNFTIANSAPDQTVVLTAGTGITTSGTYPSFTVTNSAPDQTVAITAGTGISVSGTYPNFTVTNSSPSSGGTVTSVAALTIGTTGTDLSSTVVNDTTTPVITLQVPTASATNRGALSSSDWTTFNSKQAAITLTTTGSTGAATFISNTLNIPSYTDQFVGTVTSVDLTAGTGITVSGGPITTSGSITVNNSDRGSSQNIFKNINVITSQDWDDSEFVWNVDDGSWSGGIDQEAIVADNNNDTLFIESVGGISITTDSATDTIYFDNIDKGSEQNIFKNIAVAGQPTIVADVNDDILTVAAGSGVTITTNATTDTITISATGSGGSVTSVATTAPITGGTITTTGTIGITQAGVATDGYLSSTDWNTFNSKEPALTKGNLTEATSSVLTITGGIGAVIGSGTTIQVSQAGASASGFLSSTDWNTFNNKQGTITLTTTGSTGAATFISNTLNIPNYTDQFVGTVTSVAALTLGTTGTDLSSTVVNGTTTPVITLQVPTASATNRGALSSADWTTFNGKASNSFTTIAVATQNSIVAATATDTLTVVGGTGITVTTSHTTDTLTVTNSAPDQTVALTAGTGITVSGTYPSFTVANSQPANPPSRTESLNFKAATPYTVVTPFNQVVIDFQAVELQSPSTIDSGNKVLAIVTLEVENTATTGFTGFTLRLYNQTTAAVVTNAQIRWSSYMYPSSTEFGYTSFTYHIPIDDTGVSLADVIELQLQLEVGTCDINVANFTLMSITK